MLCLQVSVIIVFLHRLCMRRQYILFVYESICEVNSHGVILLVVALAWAFAVGGDVRATAADSVISDVYINAEENGYFDT